MLSSRPVYMPITAAMRWSCGRAICRGAHSRFMTVSSGDLWSTCTPGLGRLADRADQGGGVGDGAGHDLLHGLPGPLGKRCPKIGDEPVKVEHWLIPS